MFNWLKRKPDQIIGLDYMHRWCLLPRNRWFNIYLHKFMHDDDDRALHDHPWWSVSFLISGGLHEVFQEGGRIIIPYWPYLRSPTHTHRIELLTKDAWTIFIVGPRTREWGFHCPKGWRHWKEFVDERDHGQIGRGCD